MLEVGLDGNPMSRRYNVRIVPQNRHQSVLLLLEPAEVPQAADGA